MSGEDEPTVLAAGTPVDRFVVDRVLGVGGMATVYRVRHRQLGTVHALKLLTLDRPSIRRRIEREARVQAAVRHPNLVAVTDVVEHEGMPGLVLEYVHGPTLAQLLAHLRPTLPQIDSLARGIVRGVIHAHAHGAIHRDLKPSNVLVAVTDHALVPKVADFGLVKLTDVDRGHQTRVGTVMGTPAYMSPEQFDDASAVDERTDVWSLGALLYELCTGRCPFPGATTAEVLAKVTRGDFAPPQQLAPDLPERMARAVTGALLVDRGARFPSARTLLDAWCDGVPDEQIPGVFHRPAPIWDEATLGMAQEMCSDVPNVALSPTGSPATWSEPLLEPPRRRAWLGAVAAALAVAALGVGFGGVAAAGWWWSAPPAAAPVAAAEPVEHPVVTPASAEATPSPVVEPAVAVPPRAPRPPIAAVEPRAAPPPDPPAAPPPQPEVAEVEVAEDAPRPARFRVEGEVDAVYLVSDASTVGPGDPLPPGRYFIQARFEPGDPLSFEGDNRRVVAEGDQLAVRCSRGLRKCTWGAR